MFINHNIMALTAYRHYAHNVSMYARSLERLSTGYRINRAADDPAGLAISEKMRAQIRGLNMAARNCQSAISLVQTAEGALQEAHNILQRMSELAVQAASDTNESTIDRDALNREFQELLKELDDTAKTANFNNMPLLDGSRGGAAATNVVNNSNNITDISVMPSGKIAEGANFSFGISGYPPNTLVLINEDGSHIAEYAIQQTDLRAGSHTVTFNDGTHFSYTVTGGDFPNADALITALDVSFDVKHSDPLVVQTGANAGDTLAISIEAMSGAALGLSGASIATREQASEAIARVGAALKAVASQRASLGATQNRLEYKLNTLETMSVNLQEAESRIRDVDIAKEMTELLRYQILMQASMAMMAQANALPAMVLELLKTGTGT